MTAPNIQHLAHRGWSLHDHGHHWVHPLRTAGYHSTLIDDHTTSTIRLLDRLGLSAPADGTLSPPLKRQSDATNDDWVHRYSEIRLGTELDLVPATPA